MPSQSLPAPPEKLLRVPDVMNTLSLPSPPTTRESRKLLPRLKLSLPVPPSRESPKRLAPTENRSSPSSPNAVTKSGADVERVVCRRSVHEAVRQIDIEGRHVGSPVLEQIVNFGRPCGLRSHRRRAEARHRDGGRSCDPAWHSAVLDPVRRAFALPLGRKAAGMERRRRASWSVAPARGRATIRASLARSGGG